MATDDGANADNRNPEETENASPLKEKGGEESEYCDVDLNGTFKQSAVDLKSSASGDGKSTKEENIEKGLYEKSETLELPDHESSKSEILPEILVLANGSSGGVRNVASQTLKSECSSKKKPGLVRHIMALLALSSIILANMNRQAFNQALVRMTRPISEISVHIEDSNELRNNSDTLISTTYPPISDEPSTATTPTETVTDEPDFDDRFDWTGPQIGTLQAAFSYGYAPFMIPGGRMSELYGAKWLVFASGFGSALCCILSPFLADTNYTLLVASRVFMGLCQTGISPALYAMLTRWLPPDESSVYLPMIKVAVMLGFMFGSLVSGFFTWRVTFYFVGLIGLIWSALWAFLASSDPRENKMISEVELGYIQHEIRLLNKGRALSAGSSRKKAAPWIRILTNPVVIGFILAKFTVKLSTDSQSMQIPMYLKNVFKVSSELNGVLSATNFAIQGIFTGLVAWWAKELIVRKSYGLDKTGVRRLFQGINNFGMGFAYIIMTFSSSSLPMVCGAFVILSTSSMFGAGGEAVTPVDLSIEYSASIMAIANSLANMSGIVLPQIVSFVLANQLDNSERWNIVWWIVGGLTISGGVIYSCMVKAELQDFRSPDKKEIEHADSGQSQMVTKQESSTCIELKVTKSRE